MEISSRTELYSGRWRVSGEVTLKNMGFVKQCETGTSSKGMEMGQKQNSQDEKAESQNCISNSKKSSCLLKQ